MALKYSSRTIFLSSDCDTDHYTVVAAVRDRLSLSQRGTQKFNMQRCELKNLKEVELWNFMRVKSQTG
jgi:predicted metal-dependent TIM-barrel fold hydrolase